MKGFENTAPVLVAGAGLAGVEAAIQLARRGIPVQLAEMKPSRFSPAHRSSDFAELVCSNSFKASGLEQASGLLQEELRRLGSVVLDVALRHSVAAGQALAVDRGAFSREVTEIISSHPLVEVMRGEVTELPHDRHA
ncbi:MAG TPA: FAD-dependent oxidoreductase, partial [Geobacteraceae bacterium]